LLKQRGRWYSQNALAKTTWPKHPVGKRLFARLARARKRHYTFGRRFSIAFLVKSAK
jgi:hypothetical protein